MEYKRKIFPEEVALIAFLASKAQFQLESNWENKFIAYPLTKEKIGVSPKTQLQAYSLKHTIS